MQGGGGTGADRVCTRRGGGGNFSLRRLKFPPRIRNKQGSPSINSANSQEVSHGFCADNVEGSKWKSHGLANRGYSHWLVDKRNRNKTK